MITDKQVPPVSSPDSTGQPIRPKAPSAPPMPTLQERRLQEVEQAQREARDAKATLIPAALSLIINMDQFGSMGIQRYVNDFLAEAGSPTDPVERVLVQQLLIAHHRAALLQARAEKSKHLEEIKILNSAATRLVAEIRRLALSIRQYRAPIASKSFSVVHQQNIASGTEQHVQFVDRSTPNESSVSFSSQTELRGKAPSGDNHEPSIAAIHEERAARNCRQDQRIQTASVDG